MYVIINTGTVRNAMNKKIMCVSKLSELSGVKDSTIAHILTRGKYARVQDKNLFAIAEALGQKPDYFTADLTYVENERANTRSKLRTLKSRGKESDAKEIETLEKKLAYLDKLVK